MRYRLIISIFVVIVFSSFFLGKIAQTDQALPLAKKIGFNMKLVEHGRYLIKIAGCNDCHTVGYPQANGKVPVESWLMGDIFGWKGAWGTTYGTNLRLLVADLTETEWIEMSKTLESRPPMPWFNLNAIKASDLRSIYQFVRYLGPGGKLAPNYLPPDKEPEGPYAIFPAPPK
jgi:hypothetical protein